jgi:hypothetical protein
VLTVVLILLLIGAALAVLLWVGSVWFHNYVYNGPPEGLNWRAPAAAAALTAFLALWCLLDYRAGDPDAAQPPYDTLFRFSARDDFPAKPYPRFWAVRRNKETRFERSGSEYRDPATGRTWNRSTTDGLVEAIIVEEGGERVTYKLEPPPGGVFKDDQKARYVEDGGRRRVLTEDDVRAGQVSVFRTGRFLVNLLLNFLFLALWFVCLWLLLRLQWPHALGLAAAAWLVMTLIITPLVLDRTQAAVRLKASPGKTTAPPG